MRRFKKLFATGLLGLGLTILTSIAAASPALGPQPWGLFGFDGVGTPVVPCLPTDCTEISANAFYLGDAPWTFTGFGFLIIQDAFNIGDQFRVFDNGAEIGITTAPIGSGSCGVNPDDCFLNDNVSKGIFGLDDGFHSFTMTQIAGTPGAGYLCVSTSRDGCSPVTAPEPLPEPTSIFLLGLGIVGAFWWTKRPRLSEVMVWIERKRQRR